MINPWLEWTAVAFSVAGVWMMVQRRLLGWPLGLAAVVLYTVVFSQARLYSDALLQLVFGGFVVYGWWNWRHQAQDDGRTRVEPLSGRRQLHDLGLGVALGIALGTFMATQTDAQAPRLDAMLAALSLVAQWWQARRHACAWWLWLAVDVVYVGLYASKSLHATAVLYLLFIVLAARGLYSWRRAEREAAGVPAASPALEG